MPSARGARQTGNHYISKSMDERTKTGLVVLQGAAILALLAILSVLLLPRMRVPAQVAGVFHYVVAFLWSSLDAFLAPFALVGSDVTWSSMPADGWRKHLGSALHAILLAAPLVL